MKKKEGWNEAASIINRFFSKIKIAPSSDQKTKGEPGVD
jgi:hypothetical protein